MTNEQTTNSHEFMVPRASQWNLIAPENRGILFDIIIFLINLTLMGFLAPFFTNVARQAYQGVIPMQLLVFFFFIILFLLQPFGANFKRWQFHQRRRAGRRRKKSSDAYVFTFQDSILLAILFNPLLYFAILLFTTMVIISFSNELIIGKKVSDDDSLFIMFVLLGFLISVVHSMVVYYYFTSPTKEPKNKIWYSQPSGLIGDVLLFVNILIFQILWNIVGQIPSQSMNTLGDYMVRAFFLIGMALLVYFPSRIFYSAEDIRKPLAWFTILLANSPIIIRFLIP
jgi:protein-S-isoprenylcysteine O-methyltransferase Ste14